MTKKAYKNNESFKQQILMQNQKHVKLDHLIQGTGWNTDTQKGCFIGCSINEYDHEKASKILGMPEWLMHLCDKIHEGLDKKDTAKFFLEFFKSVKTGTTVKEFEKIKIQFLHFLLTEILPEKHQQKPTTKNVINALQKTMNGEKVSNWKELRSAAYDTVVVAVDAAAVDAAAVDAAIAVTADVAVTAVTDVATVAVTYAAGDIGTVKMNTYKKISEKLIALVSEC